MAKSIKGTQTEKNLLTSFAGESQARMRYTYFASAVTKREKEILILIRQGFLSKEIAYKLNLSIYTVNNHRKNILAKLNVDNAIEAINKAENFGILY